MSRNKNRLISEENEPKIKNSVKGHSAGIEVSRRSAEYNYEKESGLVN